MEDTAEARRYRSAMVENQLLRRGITDKVLLEAFEKVPRHFFCPAGISLADAYGDFPLAIGEGQTISQPVMVASMTEQLQLQGGERVLEVGTGSGYQAAILAWICDEVYTIERHSGLAERARSTLDEFGLDNVHVKTEDGTEGWRDNAPYDGIIVTASAPDVPAPLKDQLLDGGRLVVPIGSHGMQQLTVIVRDGDKYSTEVAEHCTFVPLIGRYGWDA